MIGIWIIAAIFAGLMFGVKGFFSVIIGLVLSFLVVVAFLTWLYRR